MNYTSATQTAATIRVTAANACGSSQPGSLAVVVNLACREVQDQPGSGIAVPIVYPNPSNGLFELSFVER